MGRLSKEHWLAQKWGALHLDPLQVLPNEWATSSRERFRMVCDCGRAITPLFSNVTHAQRSCGRCRRQPREAWLQQKWGALRIIPEQPLPDDWGPYSEHRLDVMCDCGRSNLIRFSDMAQHGTKSCGHCSDQSRDYWLTKTYNKLRLTPGQFLPESWGPGLSQPLTFNCSCGKQAVFDFDRVNSGHNKSCGRCLDHSKQYWLEQRWGKIKLDPEQNLFDYWGSGSNQKVAIICECGGHKLVNFYDLTTGKVKSCGCARLGMKESSPALDIYRYVRELASDAQLSHRFFAGQTETDGRRKLEYDIYVPSKKLAIEFHGLHWHTEDKVRDRDYQKYLFAVARGDRLIQVYSDEWGARRAVVEQLLASLLFPVRGKRVKPRYEIERTTSFDSLKFMDQYHYIGGSSGFLTIKAVWRDQMVGVWVFKKRNQHVAVWHRAAWNHAFQAWNPHDAALAVALPILRREGVKTLLTFSDNRLHTGELYKKLGFKLDALVPPNYYYTDGRTRKTKYAFRVDAGVDEQEAARKRGWYRIWDSGKKRFSLPI